MGFRPSIAALNVGTALSRSGLNHPEDRLGSKVFICPGRDSDTPTGERALSLVGGTLGRLWSIFPLQTFREPDLLRTQFHRGGLKRIQTGSKRRVYNDTHRLI